MATEITVRALIDPTFDYEQFAINQGLSPSSHGSSEDLITISVSDNMTQTQKDDFDAAYALEQAKNIYA